MIATFSAMFAMILMLFFEGILEHNITGHYHLDKKNIGVSKLYLEFF